MKFARGPDGTQIFSTSDFLTEQQVTSYFSWLAGKRRHQPADDKNRTPSDNKVAPADKQNYAEVRSQTLREVELGHPIICDNYTLCLLYSKGKLRTFCGYVGANLCVL